MLIVVLVVAGLIVVNGLFVAAEFAIAGVSRPAMERRAAHGSRMARTVLRTVSDPRRQDRYIATAQLGITLATVGLGMYGEHELAVWFHDVIPADGWLSWLGSHAAASIIALAVVTYFHIVVGEMVPKALALQNAERTALWITPVMLWTQRALFPLVVGLNAMGNLVLRMAGIRREASREQFYTPEELRFIVRETSDAGELETEAAKLLAELFEFGELAASDIMVPRVRVRGLALGTPAARLVEVLGEGAHTRYPVYEGDLDHIVGMVHIKDVYRIVEARRSLGRGDARPIEFIPETSRLDTVLAAMSRSRAQMVAVLDEYGGIAGVVTIEDVFEEVVGNVDEAANDELQAESEGSVLAAGTLRLAELGEHWDLDLEHEDVDTVGGLVLLLLDREPRPGDRVEFKHLAFDVLTVSGHGVGTVRVRLQHPGDHEDGSGE